MNSAVGLLGQIQELLRSPSLTNGRRHDAEEALAVAINVLTTGTEAPDLLEELERVVAELRRRLVPVKAVPIADEHLAQLEGLPDAPIFCWVAGKAPKYENWNLPKNLKTPLQIVSETPPAGFVPTGVGMISGTDFMAVDFDEPDPDPETGEIKGSAEAEFLAVFKRPSTDLPKSATTISGKPGRRRTQLRVPKEWQGWLHDYSYAGTALEVRYGNQEKEGQASKGFRQSVICGPHPNSPTPGEWYFRWAEGLSPAEVGIAEAPVWLLQRLLYLKGCRSAEKGVTLAAGGENGTWFTSLPPQKQIELLKKMADGDHWPRRGGENGTHQAGHWPLLVKLGCGLLWSFNGNPNAVHHHFKDTTWAKKFDWSDKAVHGSLLGWLQSLKPSEELRSTIGTLVWLATRTHTNEGDETNEGTRLTTDPYKLPKNILPPKEIDAGTLTTGVAKKLAELAKALKVIDDMESPLERECAYQNLTKILDCTEKELKMLLRHSQESANPVVGGDWNAVVKRAKPIEVAVERLLAFNALTIVASDGGVGKSVLIYRLAEAAANGGLFAGHLQAAKGKVLIVQKDESDSNLAAKDALMQAHMPEGMVRVEFTFNGGMLPELRKWIQEHQARYVFMDSLFSLFGTDGDLSESAVGTYMYLLNNMAAQENCAIVLTHHLRKADKSKSGKRSEIHNQDLYGSSFIVNGTSDVWGVIRDPEASSPTFLLKVLKPRSGITAGGDTYRLSGSLEDLSFQLETVNNVQSKDAIEGLRKSEQKVLAVLRERKSAEVGLSKQDLVANTGVSPSGVEKALTRLLADTRMGVKRVAVHAGTGAAGRPVYVYWAG